MSRAKARTVQQRDELCGGDPSLTMSGAKDREDKIHSQEGTLPYTRQHQILA